MVQPDFKSHAKVIMNIGQGAIQSVSRKQKLKARISTEAELVAVDDVSIYNLWTVLFIKWKGYNIDKKILYKENKSEITMEVNGNRSAGKRIWELNICHF